MAEPLIKSQLEQIWQYVEQRINKKLYDDLKSERKETSKVYQNYCDKCEELDSVYEKLRDAISTAYDKGHERALAEDNRQDYFDSDIERIMDYYFPEEV
jgi:chromosome segregation ATPase